MSQYLIQTLIYPSLFSVSCEIKGTNMKRIFAIFTSSSQKHIDAYLSAAVKCSTLKGKTGGYQLNHTLLAATGKLSNSEIRNIYNALFAVYSKFDASLFWRHQGAAEMCRHIEYTLGIAQTDWTGDYAHCK